jgi:hypothetical protein
MSNVGLILEEKAADIGNFLVGDCYHFVKKDMSDHLYLSTIWDQQK